MATMFTTIFYKIIVAVSVERCEWPLALCYCKTKTISSSALVKTKWVVNMKENYNYYDILNNRSHSHAIDVGAIQEVPVLNVTPTIFCFHENTRNTRYTSFWYSWPH